MPPETQTTEAQKAEVRLNPQFVEKLAGIVKEEHLKLFDSDLAQAIANARAQIDRTQAVEAAMRENARQARPGKVKLEREQVGEWFRCKLAQSAPGQVANPEPDPDLDADGIISQMLRMTGRGFQTQALGPATGSAGGNLIPDDFKLEIERAAAEPAVVWPLLSKTPTRLESVTLPAENSTGAVNVGTAANSSSTTYSDTVTEVALTVKQHTWTMRYFDAFVPIKIDLLNDSPLNVMEYVTERVGDQFAVKRESEVLQGPGSMLSRPLGLLHGNTGLTAVSISAALSLTNLMDSFISEIPQRYRNGTQYKLVMGSAAYFSMARLLATNVYSASYLLGMLPGMLESAYVPDGVILGGNFRYYRVYHNTLMGMVSAVRPQTYTMDIAFVEKWDGLTTITDAFRTATGITYS